MFPGAFRLGIRYAGICRGIACQETFVLQTNTLNRIFGASVIVFQRAGVQSVTLFCSDVYWFG